MGPSDRRSKSFVESSQTTPSLADINVQDQSSSDKMVINEDGSSSHKLSQQWAGSKKILLLFACLPMEKEPHRVRYPKTQFD